MIKKETSYIFLIILMLLGIVISLQFRSILHANRQKAMSAYSVDGLKKQLEEQNKALDKLKKEIDEMEKKKEEHLKQSADNQNDSNMKLLLDRLASANLKAGLTKVKGQGVTIKMDDAQLRKNVDPRELIIHDSYVVRVLNELKKAGAQAISINGERLVATSEQICAGPTIRINKNRYAVPYEIQAIGNPDLLFDGIDKSKIAALLRERSIRLDISKSKELVIPKYVDNLEKISSNLEVVK